MEPVTMTGPVLNVGMWTFHSEQFVTWGNAIHPSLDHRLDSTFCVPHLNAECCWVCLLLVLLVSLVLCATLGMLVLQYYLIKLSCINISEFPFECCRVSNQARLQVSLSSKIWVQRTIKSFFHANNLFISFVLEPDMPDGSWKCEKCNNINYPFRTKCNRQNCGADKPPETKDSPSEAADADNQVCCVRCSLCMTSWLKCFFSVDRFRSCNDTNSNIHVPKLSIHAQGVILHLSCCRFCSYHSFDLVLIVKIAYRVSTLHGLCLSFIDSSCLLFQWVLGMFEKVQSCRPALLSVGVWKLGHVIFLLQRLSSFSGFVTVRVKLYSNGIKFGLCPYKFALCVCQFALARYFLLNPIL